MRVGIDISAAVYDRGVSRYTTNLVRALLPASELELSLYGCSFRQSERLEAIARDFKNQAIRARRPLKSVIQNYPPKLQTLFWNTLGRNQISAQLPNLDLFHSWDWLQPPDRNLPLISTIHDLAILKFPETAHPEILKMHQQSWKVLKERQAHVLAVSQSTKKDIVELIEIPSSRVHVTYEALPHETLAVSQSLEEEQYDQLKAQLHLERPFLLFVGTREPRKNLVRLIQAWEPFAPEYDLVIAGESGWDESTNVKLSATATSRLHFLGKVSDQVLSVLYAEAELFAYPSLYEGFGLPILEAFHYGTPVLTSNVSSMPEVAGNAAELINPEEVESIREGLENILKETKEAQQKRLQKMIIRLHLFSWQRTAELTTKAYLIAGQS
jgi:glycosyltransferase involved in cell wall biosynthesis